MAALGELVVKLSANIAEFTGAMDKAAYTSQKRMEAMERHAKAAGVAIAAAMTAAATATAIAIRSQINSADEMRRLADVAGASVERFSAMSYAVERHGVAAEKLADVYKDVQDKVGDFLQNGGGPMKDFFDNIAPRVGVTAAQFKNLSGPDALQLYYNSLDKANLSQSELVFYMEAIASDSTKLIPLLRDSGKGFSEAADEASRLGLVISTETAESAAQFNDNMLRMSRIVTGAANTLMVEMLPALTRLSDEFVLGMKNSDGFLDALLRYGLTNPFANLEGNLARIQNELEQVDYRLSNGRSKDEVADREKFRRLEQEASYYRELINLQNRRSAAPPDTSSSSVMLAAADRARKEAEAQSARAASAKKQAEMIEQATQREGASVFAATRTAAEQLAAEYERLDGLLEKGAISWDTYGRAVMDAQEKLMPMAKATKVAETNIKEVEKAASSVDIVITNSFQSAADAIANFAMGGKMSFGDMVNSMVRDLLRLEMQMQMTAAYKSVGGLSGLGSLIGGWFGAASGSTYNTNAFSQQSMMLAAQDAGLAGRANGGYMSAGTTYLVGERGPELLTLGSSSGSMTPNHALGGASLESVRVEIRNEGTPQEVTRAQPRFDAEGLIVEVFTRDIANEGPMAKSMQSRFGLSRAAGAYA